MGEGLRGLLFHELAVLNPDIYRWQHSVPYTRDPFGSGTEGAFAHVAIVKVAHERRRGCILLQDARRILWSGEFMVKFTLKYGQLSWELFEGNDKILPHLILSSPRVNEVLECLQYFYG